MDGKEQWHLVSENPRICGWCMTGHHESCKPKLEYYEKVWYCNCNKCNNQNDTTTKGTDENEQSSTEPLLEIDPEE